MEATLDEAPFVDFGEDSLYPYCAPGMRRIEADTRGELRAQVKQFVPRVPGVYGMLDPLGRLIYVGKSKCLRNRLISYFLPNNEEDKAGRIVESTGAIVWESQPSDFAAWMREQSLIRTLQPRFNVQGIPKRLKPIFVCLGRSPAEQLYTARKEDPKAIAWIGPLQGASRANRAVEVLNRLFQLRDCSSSTPLGFTEQMQLFDIELRPGCIRHEIRTCLGPCIRGCSRKAYEAQVKSAREFLAGKNDDPIAVIEKQMLRAAGNLQFEQALVLREDLRAIEWLSRRAGDISRAKNTYTFVYSVAGFDGQDVWYLIRRGQIEGALAAPKTNAEVTRTHQLVRQWFNQDNHVGTKFIARPETLALVTSWFRNNRPELKNTLKPKHFAEANA
ncbi:MAG: GIY-YIG nuclease family protein [Pirellulaceae bacterium]|nr:GIY-YIG nuclease family protein [Pirellulaceae bacterium]